MSNFPGVGDAFPDIVMETPEGGEVKPSDFAGSKLVVFFYPKDDTPGCTTENKDFSALKTKFEAAGTKLLGVSKDPAKKARQVYRQARPHRPAWRAMRKRAGFPTRSACGPKSRCTARPTWAWSARPIWWALTARLRRSGTR